MMLKCYKCGTDTELAVIEITGEGKTKAYPICKECYNKLADHTPGNGHKPGCALVDNITKEKTADPQPSDCKANGSDAQ